MSKPSQQTLGKFFQLPPGTKPPPKQQSTLSFDKKKADEANEVTNDEIDKQQVEPAPIEQRKRRRIVDSDDETDAVQIKSEDSAMEVDTNVALDKSSDAGKENQPEEEEATSNPQKAPKKPKSPPKKKKIKSEAKTEESKEKSPSKAAKVKRESSAASEDPAVDPVEQEQEAENAIELEKEDIKAAKKLASFSWTPEEGETTWKKGDPVPYAALCKTFEAIEATSKRLIISELLTKFFLTVIALSPQHLLQTVYLCINRVCPDYEGLELGIGEGLLVKAIAEATGRSLAQIKKDYQETGDLGLVAKNSRANQPMMFKPKPLTVPAVFASLKEIAMSSGHSVGIIKKLMGSCVGGEAKWIVRSLEGKLRIGLAGQTLLVALGHSMALSTSKKGVRDPTKLEAAANTVKQVFSELPSYDILIPALLEYGIDDLETQCKITPGVPLKPMLAKPTKAIMEVLEKFEGKPFTCEYKYDGERCQIHLVEGGKTLMFSRNSENMSNKYPDVLSHLHKFVKEGTRSFVIDGEVVGWDTMDKRILPFQVLSTRKRKDVTEENIKVKVCVFAFDILYLNGEPLLRHTFEERRALLHEAFQEVEGEFTFAKYNNGTDLEEIQAFLDEAVKGHCEGLMVKMLHGIESHYEPSRRSMHWLKVKKDYLSGVGDSLDLVVVGAYHGRGKRTNFYGAFLLACYDPANEEYQTICKIGTGFSDEDLDNHFRNLKELVIQQPRGYYKYADATKPDVWFEPKQVWEVLTADLSVSPIYQAAVGVVDPTKGISLRFPRFLGVRSDKGPEDATTGEQVAEMYEKQQVISAQRKSTGGGAADDDFDY